MAYRRREDNLSDVLDEEEVEQLRAMRAKGATYKEIAEVFGVHPNTVRNILKRAMRRV